MLYSNPNGGVGFLCHHTIQNEKVRSQRLKLQGSAPARHVDVDFTIFWGWGRESIRPDHPPPTYISTSLGTPFFRGFLRSSPSSTPRVSPTAPPGLPQGEVGPSRETSSLGTPPPLQALPCLCSHLGWACHVGWHT